MTEPLLSPLALVALICALTGLALGGYFLVKRLRTQLGGPQHTRAVWSILAIFAIPLAALIGLAGAADSLIATAPAMVVAGGLIQLAPRMSPLPAQLSAIGVAVVGAGTTVLICGLRAAREADRNEIFICIACGAVVVLMLISALRALPRPDDKPDTGTPA